MRKILFSFFVSLFVFSFPVFSHQIKNLSFSPETGLSTCTYLNTKREFVLCLPDESNENWKNGDRPLILMLHGYGSNAQAFMETTKFHLTAGDRGYAVVYVSGIPRPTDRTSAPGFNYSDDKYGKTDLNFLVDLTRYLQKEYKLNKKVFVVGFSNGGFMGYKLASQKSEIFKGFASVGGMMPENVWEKRSNKNTTAVLQINGSLDEVVPMKLNDSAKYNPNPAIEDVLEYFAAAHNVKDSLSTERLSENTWSYNYGNKVKWVLIEGARHYWPSKQTLGTDLNALILDFFEGCVCH